MELHLAKQSKKHSSKSVKVRLEDLLHKYSHGERMFYFAPSNAHKDMLAAVASLEKQGYRAYLSEVRISADDKDFIYSLHII
ncbi:HP0268 family nuclease [Helicobacter salomonis]|uniref:HP0268 family nuclease n=1 Tax=Helicobacter salomonis TaxID=56878 RepID=UPI000CF18F09|nr:HP0268 family nuclease [Helicobacter salomonis]